MGQLYFQERDISIYNTDSIYNDVLSSNSIDLTITSPPYNLGIDYDEYADSSHYDAYLAFTQDWLAKVYSLTRESGRLCVNIPISTNRGGHRSITADMIHIAKNVNWKYMVSIVWNHGNMGSRSAWGSWMSASAPHITVPAEMIIVFYKGDSWKRDNDVDAKSDITKDEFVQWTNGMWVFNSESKTRIGHPAPFPRELPKRCMKMFSFVGDTILDPFMGSGTTLVEASSLKRKAIGFDISLPYCQLAQKRLLAEWAKPQQIGFLDAE